MIYKIKQVMKMSINANNSPIKILSQKHSPTGEKTSAKILASANSNNDLDHELRSPLLKMQRERLERTNNSQSKMVQTEEEPKDDESFSQEIDIEDDGQMPLLKTVQTQENAFMTIQEVKQPQQKMPLVVRGQSLKKPKDIREIYKQQFISKQNQTFTNSSPGQKIVSESNEEENPLVAFDMWNKTPTNEMGLKERHDHSIDFSGSYDASPPKGNVMLKPMNNNVKVVEDHQILDQVLSEATKLNSNLDVHLGAPPQLNKELQTVTSGSHEQIETFMTPQLLNIEPKINVKKQKVMHNTLYQGNEHHLKYMSNVQITRKTASNILASPDPREKQSTSSKMVPYVMSTSSRSLAPHIGYLKHQNQKSILTIPETNEMLGPTTNHPSYQYPTLHNRTNSQSNTIKVSTQSHRMPSPESHKSRDHSTLIQGSPEIQSQKKFDSPAMMSPDQAFLVISYLDDQLRTMQTIQRTQRTSQMLKPVLVKKPINNTTTRNSLDITIRQQDFARNSIDFPQKKQEINLKFHRAQHQWNYTMNPNNGSKKFNRSQFKQSLPAPVNMRATTDLTTRLSSYKYRFQPDGQLNEIQRKSVGNPPKYQSYRDREEMAKQIKRERKREEKEYAIQLKEQTRKFKQMFLSNSGGSVDDSESGESTPLPSSYESSRGDESEKKKIEEVDYKLKHISNSNSKEDIREISGKLGEVININLKKIVPQKGIVKGPYGRPLVVNPLKLTPSSESLVLESLKQLKDSTSGKLPETLKTEEKLPSQKPIEEHIKNVHIRTVASKGVKTFIKLNETSAAEIEQNFNFVPRLPNVTRNTIVPTSISGFNHSTSKNTFTMLKGPSFMRDMHQFSKMAQSQNSTAMSNNFKAQLKSQNLGLIIPLREKVSQSINLKSDHLRKNMQNQTLSVRRFNCTFMQSPKIKSEFVKTIYKPKKSTFNHEVEKIILPKIEKLEPPINVVISEKITEKIQTDFSDEKSKEPPEEQEVDDYQQFVQDYSAPRTFQNPLTTPIENYEFPTETAKTMKMLENIVKYKNENSMKADKVISVSKTLKQTKKRRIEKSMSSESISNSSSMITIEAKPKIKKGAAPQKLCVVQQKALKMVHNMYVEDSRYIIDPQESDRINFINTGTGPVVDCNDHGDFKNDDGAKKEMTNQVYQKFYDNLLNPKHDKVKQEKLLQQFIQKIMEDPSLKSLKKRILNLGKQNCSDFDILRDVNPHIFLKKGEEKVDNSAKLTEAMDDKTHHQFSFNPNRKIFVDQNIINLFKEQIKKELDPKKDTKNQLIDQNIKNRSIQKQKDSLVKGIQRHLSKKNIELNGESMLNFNQKLEEYIHFQNAAKQDFSQRVSSRNIQRLLEQDIMKSKKKEDENQVDNLFNNLEVIEVDENTEDNQVRSILFKKQLISQKYYSQQKAMGINNLGQKNAQIEFFDELKAKNCVNIPEFVNIQNYTLCIQNKYMNTESIEALSNYIIAQTKLQNTQQKVPNHQIFIHNLIIDDIRMKDLDFATLLGAISLQARLISLTYSNNDFGKNSLISLSEMLRGGILENLRLTNLKIDQGILISLLNQIDQMSKPLKKLKLSSLNLNHPDITYFITNQFYINPGLLEIDLSHSKMLPANFNSIIESLAGEFGGNGNGAKFMKVNSLNISYISTNGFLETISENIAKIVELSKFLMHLDISGLNLSTFIKPIINQVKSNKILISLHMHDNALDPKTSDFVMKKMGIEAQDFHKLHDSFNLYSQHQKEMTILQKSFAKLDKIRATVHKFFKQNETTAEVNIINHQITSELKNIKNQILAENTSGAQRQHLIQDPLIFTRKIGHPELIFNQNPYWLQEFSVVNSEEKWSFGQECYACEKHCYVQIYYRRSRANLDFKKITDKKLLKKLIKTYDLDCNESYNYGAPIILSSVNGWILTRFLDVNIFSQLLKGQDDDFIQKSIEKQTQELEKQQMLLEIENEKLAEKKEGSPKKTEKKSTLNLDDFAKNEMLRVKERSKKITRSISGMGFGYSQIVGIKKSNQNLSLSSMSPNILNQKKKVLSKGNTVEFDDNDGEDFVDIIAAREWREVVEKCQKYKKESVIINYPPFDGKDETIFIYAGFVKPGRHVLVIFDPETREFYQKDFVVEVRKCDILAGQGKEHIDINSDLFQQDDFIFREWQLDTPEFLNIVAQTDFDNNDLFSSVKLGMPKDLFLEVMGMLRSNFSVFSEAYKIYLVRSDFPSTGIKKFIQFLETIQQLKSKDKTLNYSEAGLMQIFDQEVGRKNIGTHQVLRAEFIQKILLVSFKNFKQMHPNLQEFDFLDYFVKNPIKMMNSYIKKMGQAMANFRESILWTGTVNAVLKANKDFIHSIHDKFRIGFRFTLESAFLLLKSAGINLERPSSKLSHNEHVLRIFGMSKQTVKNETEMYFYSFLEEIEVFEFLARVADTLYHTNNVNLVASNEKEIHLKKMALLPLELKVFELLSQKLAPLVDLAFNDLKELHLEKIRSQMLEGKNLEPPAQVNTHGTYSSFENLSHISEEFITPPNELI